MITDELRSEPMVAEIEADILSKAEESKSRGVIPRLVAIVTSADPSLLAYVRSKERFAAAHGITYEVAHLESADQEVLEKKLEELSSDAHAHGIIIELPLNSGLDFISALNHVAPEKDVDGLTPHNLGLTLRGREESALLAATAQSCVVIAESLGPLAGRRVTLVGKGKTVGRPLIPMLLNRGATLTVADSKTKDLKAALAGAEIVIVGVGKPGLITGDMIEEGQILIDAGLTVVGENLLGDVDRASVEGIAAKVTPVKGGVGALTTAILFRNLMKAIELQELGTRN